MSNNKSVGTNAEHPNEEQEVLASKEKCEDMENPN